MYHGRTSSSIRCAPRRIDPPWDPVASGREIPCQQPPTGAQMGHGAGQKRDTLRMEKGCRLFVRRTHRVPFDLLLVIRSWLVFSQWIVRVEHAARHRGLCARWVPLSGVGRHARATLSPCELNELRLSSRFLRRRLLLPVLPQVFTPPHLLSLCRSRE